MTPLHECQFKNGKCLLCGKSENAYWLEEAGECKKRMAKNGQKND